MKTTMLVPAALTAIALAACNKDGGDSSIPLPTTLDGIEARFDGATVLTSAPTTGSVTMQGFHEVTEVDGTCGGRGCYAGDLELIGNFDNTDLQVTGSNYVRTDLNGTQTAMTGTTSLSSVGDGFQMLNGQFVFDAGLQGELTPEGGGAAIFTDPRIFVVLGEDANGLVAYGQSQYTGPGLGLPTRTGLQEVQ